MSMPPKPKFQKILKIYLLSMTGLIAFFIVFIANVDWYIRLENGAVLLGICVGIPLGIYLPFYIEKWYSYNLSQKNYQKYLEREIKRAKSQLVIAEKHEAEKQAEQAEIEAEYKVVVASQNATEPWTVRYSTSPCPYCGHYKVRCAKWEDKSLSIAFWGIASSKIGTNYKCEHCKRMW